MSRQILPIAAGLIVLCALGWYLDSLAHRELTQAARLLIAGLSGTILLILAITLVAWGWIAVERVRITRARRRIVEREADVHVVTAGDAVYVRELNPRAVWRPLHLNPVQYQNGTHDEPSPMELAIYRLWYSSRVPSAPEASTPPLLLGAGHSIPEILPILDKAQRVLIIGATDAGKTNLLQWIVARRAGSVIVIDPHASPAKWPPQAKVAGTGSNHAEIETVLDKLIELMVRRYKDIGQGLVREGEHPKLAIVIDEWMSIAYQCKNATEVMVRLLTESRKAAMSVVIGSHSERIKSLGLDGRGDLRDGFLIVRLWLEEGERRATYDYGRGERPCVLPGKYEPPQDAAPVVEIATITEVKPTEVEERILALHDAGERESAIAAAVFGSKGGPQNAKVRNVLTKFGRV